MSFTPPILTSVSTSVGSPQPPQLSLSWDPQNDYTGPFTINVFNGQTQIAGTASGMGASYGSWTASAAMPDGPFYIVEVGSPTVSGVYSNSLQLLLEPVVPTAVTFDGATIVLQWNSPSGNPPPGQVAALLRAGSYAQAATMPSVNPTGANVGSFAPDLLNVPPGAAWSITLAPLLGASSGPNSASFAVVTLAPPATALHVLARSGNTQPIQIDTPANAAYGSNPQFVATVFADGAPIYVSPPAAATGTTTLTVAVTIPSPPAPLATTYAYTASLRLVTTAGGVTSSGPRGTALPLLMGGATITAVSYTAGSPDSIVTVSATLAPGSVATGIVARLFDPSGNFVAQTAGNSTTRKIAAAVAGRGYTVRAGSARGTSTGPTDGDAVYVLVTPPQITTAAYDGATLTLGWNAVGDAGVTGYSATVLTGGVAGVAAVFGGTSGSLALAPGAASVQLQAIGDRTAGPPSAAIPLVTQAPSLTGVAFDAVTGAPTVSWTAVPSATAFVLRLLDGANVVATHPIGAGATSFAITDALSPQGSYSVQLQSQLATGGAAASGPWSVPLALVASAPANVRIAYNGQTANLTWNAIPGIGSYRVSLLSGGSVTSHADVNGTSASLSATNASGSVVVQALVAGSTGAPSPAAALFSAGFYLSTSTADAPYVAPANAPGGAPYTIVLYLPQIFATPPPSSALPIVSPAPLSPPWSPPTSPLSPLATAAFVLAATPVAPFAYTLSIGYDSPAWSFSADAMRPALQYEYDGFIAQLESLSATPLGIRTVQDAISRSMPQTFAETLYYGFAFTPDQGYVDLKPGMVLRAEYESYQYLGSSTGNAAYVNGFVASAIAEYDVGSFTSGANWLTGFDAFIARVASAGGVVVPAPSEGADRRAQGGGGVIDTAFPQFQQPYVRLVYPPNFQPQNSVGTPYPEFNAALIAGPTYASVIAATQSMRGGAAVGGGVAILYFRGRTTLSAAIRVVVDGSARVVSVGTTAGNVLAAAGMRPPVTGLALDGIALARPIGAAITNPAVATSGYAVGAATAINLNWSPGASYTPVSDWLDLPLLTGDRLTTGP